MMFLKCSGEAVGTKLYLMFLPEENVVGLKDVPKMFLVRLLATKWSLMFLPEEHRLA